MPILEYADPTAPGGRRSVTTDFPLPTSGAGGASGAAVQKIAGSDGSTVVSTSNPLPVKGASSSNSSPSYEKGAYALTTDDIAQAVNAVSTNLAASDGVDLQSISVQVLVLSTYTGSFAFEVSNDGTNWSTKQLIRAQDGASLTGSTRTGDASGTAFIFSGDLGARYFRVRQYAYTSGQIRVIAVASALSTSTIPQQAVALLGGSQKIGAVNITDASGSATTQLVGSGTAASATNNALVVALSPNSGAAALAQAESGSLAALNAVAGGALDLGSMGQVQVQVTGTFNASLQFQVSNDGTNWVQKLMIGQSDLARTNFLTAAGMWFGHVGARYFRVVATSYTSGTAVVTIRYNAAAGEMPVVAPSVQGVSLRSNAAADGLTSGAVDEIALGALGGPGGIDRLSTAGGLAGMSAGSARSLAVASGLPPAASIAAAASPAAGTALDGGAARAAHTLQVDVTTTTAGTAGTHSVVLEGSLDGTYWTPLATVTPAATSTTAADASNHAAASVANAPWRVVRARWASIPTSWVGTLTARVASA